MYFKRVFVRTLIPVSLPAVYARDRHDRRDEFRARFRAVRIDNDAGVVVVVAQHQRIGYNMIIVRGTPHGGSYLYTFAFVFEVKGGRVAASTLVYAALSLCLCLCLSYA